MTIELQVVNFKSGVRYAKQWGGRYNGATQTWTVPVRPNNYSLRALGTYGLRAIDTGELQAALALLDGNTVATTGGVPATPARCQHYTRDQGCPLHGELCSNR